MNNRNCSACGSSLIPALIAVTMMVAPAFTYAAGEAQAPANAGQQAGQAQETQMNWSKSELDNIIKADDLHVSPFREDGVTYGTPTWIWCVQVDGSLYVRAYHGQKSSWYQAAVREKAGRIIAAGKTWEVAFEPVQGSINDRIDDAYRAKYHGSSYLAPMISEGARAATVKITPRATQ